MKFELTEIDINTTNNNESNCFPDFLMTVDLILVVMNVFQFLMKYQKRRG